MNKFVDDSNFITGILLSNIVFLLELDTDYGEQIKLYRIILFLVTSLSALKSWTTTVKKIRSFEAVIEITTLIISIPLIMNDIFAIIGILFSITKN
jgi:hypothetical protein